jgi:hypothetical protein
MHKEIKGLVRVDSEEMIVRIHMIDIENIEEEINEIMSEEEIVQEIVAALMNTLLVDKEKLGNKEDEEIIDREEEIVIVVKDPIVIIEEEDIEIKDKEGNIDKLIEENLTDKVHREGNP